MRIEPLKGIWLLAILLCGTPAFGQTPAEINLDFKADVKSNGVPTNIKPDASLPPAIQALVTKRVAGWRYSTITWRCEPVTTTVYGRIVAEPVPAAAGGFSLRIKDVDVREADDIQSRMNDERRTPPAYPPQLARRRVSGVLIYSYKVGQDGTPQEIDLVSPVNPDRTFRLLDTAGRAALAQWKLQPRKVNGKPVDCRVIMPMLFEIKGVPLETSDPGNTSAYRVAHADVCPMAHSLLTEPAGTML